MFIVHSRHVGPHKENYISKVPGSLKRAYISLYDTISCDQNTSIFRVVANRPFAFGEPRCTPRTCHKTRAKANVVDTMQIIGDVQGKNVILVDDIVDTAGTISKAADLMMENGAKSVRAIASQINHYLSWHRQYVASVLKVNSSELPQHCQLSKKPTHKMALNAYERRGTIS